MPDISDIRYKGNRGVNAGGLEPRRQDSLCDLG